MARGTLAREQREQREQRKPLVFVVRRRILATV
jgi:hypothetical protein